MLWEKTAQCPSIASKPRGMLLLCRGMLRLVHAELRPVPSGAEHPSDRPHRACVCLSLPSAAFGKSVGEGEQPGSLLPHLHI